MATWILIFRGGGRADWLRTGPVRDSRARPPGRTVGLGFYFAGSDKRPRFLCLDVEWHVTVRARNLKPGFFKSEQVCVLEPLTRILFSGLWCLADRNGILEDRPMRIKAEVLPYDNCDIETMLCSMVKNGLIDRYEVEGAKLISIPNFTKHQRPHHAEPAVFAPKPGKGTSSPGIGASSNVTSPESSGGIALNPSSLNPESLSLESLSLESGETGKPSGKASEVDTRPIDLTSADRCAAEWRIQFRRGTNGFAVEAVLEFKAQAEELLRFMTEEKLLAEIRDKARSHTEAPWEFQKRMEKKHGKQRSPPKNTGRYDPNIHGAEGDKPA